MLTLFQTLPWSVVLYIWPFELTVQITPGLTREMEKSVMEGGGGGGGPPAGVDAGWGGAAGAGAVAAPGAGFGVAAGAGAGCGRGWPQGTGGALFAVVRSGLTAVQE